MNIFEIASLGLIVFKFSIYKLEQKLFFVSVTKELLSKDLRFRIRLISVFAACIN